MRWILRGRDLTGATPVVPDLAANLVQRVGGEHHDMKRVDATDRVREPVSDWPRRSSRPCRRTQVRSVCSAFGRAHRRTSTVLRSRPAAAQTRPPGVVIDDDGQVALALAMGYLIDPDPSQPVEQIDLALRLIADAFVRPQSTAHITHGNNRSAGIDRRMALRRSQGRAPARARRHEDELSISSAVISPCCRASATA